MGLLGQHTWKFQVPQVGTPQPGCLRSTPPQCPPPLRALALPLRGKHAPPTPWSMQHVSGCQQI